MRSTVGIGGNIISPTTPKGLAAKLVEAALDVESVRKRGVNQKQNYNYVKAEDIAAAATKALLGKGVLCEFSVDRCDLTEITSKGGGSGMIALVHGSLIATDSETGDTITRPAVGSGSDYPGDKAVYKAMTGARKYAFIHLLGIPIGDDPEEDHGTGRSRREAMPPANPLEAERVDALRELIKERKAKGNFKLSQLDLALGACGINALRAHSAKAILERLGSLSDEQADALEKELTR